MCIFQSAFSSLNFRSKNFWREKQERTLKNIRFLILKTLINRGFSGGRNDQAALRFRVINISIENISIGNYINFLGDCQAKYEKNNFVPFEKLKNVEKCSIIGVSFAKGDGEGD